MPKEHPMSTSYDPERTTRAPRAEGFTEAYAWASSPLGDPTDSASNLPYEQDFPRRPLAPKTRRRPVDKTFVAGGLIGLLGAGAMLGVALLSTSPQPQDPAPAPASTSVAPSTTPPVVAPAGRPRRPGAATAGAFAAVAADTAPQTGGAAKLPPLCLPPPRHLVQGVCE
ncbi:hypothetical protein AWC19_08185 [Mycobacterium palustre]|uniref:Uncharacterized protein n=2 Tax=Mycobacterium palustre TaxID=153971 RepID=A0A1X1ZPH6_9MYCO|nr:hypothetical protein AWC19_08185 [Mycobacterium palustre]